MRLLSEVHHFCAAGGACAGLSIGRRSTSLRLPVVIRHILSLEDQLNRRPKLLVVGITHDLPDTHILAHIPATTRKM